MAMNFKELDTTTRGWMLARFEAEEASGNPYRSGVLTPDGLETFPELMRQAITDLNGDETTLAASLRSASYLNPTETYVRDGVRRVRRVNARQAAERLAITEFNTWYVAGLAHRLRDEGHSQCRVYRAAEPKWQPAACSTHEGQTYPVETIINNHRISYWPPPGIPDQLSIPAGPGCHHTIERLQSVPTSLRPT